MMDIGAYITQVNGHKHVHTRCAGHTRRVQIIQDPNTRSYISNIVVRL
jgi:hypothetical protein